MSRKYNWLLWRIIDELWFGVVVDLVWHFFAAYAHLVLFKIPLYNDSLCSTHVTLVRMRMISCFLCIFFVNRLELLMNSIRAPINSLWVSLSAFSTMLTNTARSMFATSLSPAPFKISSTLFSNCSLSFANFLQWNRKWFVSSVSLHVSQSSDTLLFIKVIFWYNLLRKRYYVSLINRQKFDCTTAGYFVVRNKNPCPAAWGLSIKCCCKNLFAYSDHHRWKEPHSLIFVSFQILWFCTVIIGSFSCISYLRLLRGR